jgi:two-component system nitrate/nitrite response regulator NarL
MTALRGRPSHVPGVGPGDPSPRKGGVTIRILIVDDHRLFADVIRSVLERHGMEILAVASSVEEGLASARREHPDVVLIDLGVPDGSGISLGRTIVEELPETKVIALTALNHPKVVGEALRAGFAGYLTKDTPLTQFVAMIEAAAGGEVVIPQRLAAAVVGARSAEERHASLLAEQLSPRERQVLTLLAEGASSEDIAAKLSVSPNTVRTHVQSILTKLQVHSRLEAATFAVRYGIVKVTRSTG